MTTAVDPCASSPAPPRASWTSGRSRCGRTRCASSPASSPPSGSASGAGSPAAARRGAVGDIAVWAVPFGLVGGRLYHVLTDSGAVLRRRAATRSRRSTSGRAGSASGARSRSAGSAPGSAAGAAGIALPPFADAVAPGHRWSPRRSAAGATGSTRSCSAGRPTCPGRWRSTRAPARRLRRQCATFHPTFLYESLWCLALAALRGLGRPPVPARPRPGVRAVRVGYTVGRVWIEAAHRRGRTTSSASGSTTGPRSWCSPAPWRTSWSRPACGRAGRPAECDRPARRTTLTTPSPGAPATRGGPRDLTGRATAGRTDRRTGRRE